MSPPMACTPGVLFSCNVPALTVVKPVFEVAAAPLTCSVPPAEFSAPPPLMTPLKFPPPVKRSVPALRLTQPLQSKSLRRLAATHPDPRATNPLRRSTFNPTAAERRREMGRICTEIRGSQVLAQQVPIRSFGGWIVCQTEFPSPW